MKLSVMKHDWKLDPKSTGRRIADARQRRGLSQRELAEMVEIDHAYLWRVENGAGVSAKTLRKLERALAR